MSTFFKEVEESENESENPSENECDNNEEPDSSYQIEEQQVEVKPKGAEPKKTRKPREYVMTEARRQALENMRRVRSENAKKRQEEKARQKEVEDMRKELEKYRKMKAKAEQLNELRIYRKKYNNQRQIMADLSSGDEDEPLLDEPKPKSRPKKVKSSVVVPVEQPYVAPVNPLNDLIAMFRN